MFVFYDEKHDIFNEDFLHVGTKKLAQMKAFVAMP